MSGSWLATVDPVTAAVFVGVLGTITCLLHLVSGRPGARRRAARVARIRTSIDGERGRARGDGTGSLRRRTTPGILGDSLGRIAMLLPRSAALRERLDRAGMTLGVPDLIGVAVAAGVVTAAGSFLLLGATVSIAAALGLTTATALPHLLVGSRIARRTRIFVAGFPDALDLIVRSVRAGLPAAESIQAAAREGNVVVAEVFGEVAGNLKLGMSLDEALGTAARRLQIQEFKFFVISMAIQQETGGNLAEILHNLSQMMRRRDQVKLKIKAMSSEARASAVIIGSLPFLMLGLLHLINPGYVAKLFSDPRGWMLLATGAVSMGLGIGIMAKLVRFEI